MKTGSLPNWLRLAAASVLLLAALVPAGTVHAATCTVSSYEDAGTGTLREKIDDATCDLIVFADDYTIYLASGLTVDRDVTIDGAGHTITLSGDANRDGQPNEGDVRVFLVNPAPFEPAVTFNLQNVTVERGFADSGAGIWAVAATINLTNVTLSNNTASYIGGGMFSQYNNPALVSVVFNNNSAVESGGGIFTSQGSPSLTDVTFSGNTAGRSGGGMYDNSGSPTLAKVTFSGNSARFGAGMFAGGSNPTLTNVTFSGNTAQGEFSIGGGMFTGASSPTLTNVTFSGNSAFWAGGMYNQVSTLGMTNVTFSGNLATTGGGMYNQESTLGLTNVTFSDNSATTGGGTYNAYNSSLTMLNSILYHNTGGHISNDASSTTTVTYSIVEGGYAGTGNLDADPLLGALADNGGYSQTMALLPGSPAIDAGDDSACPATDQRGVARPQGAHCDMGAYEVERILYQFSGFTSPVDTPPVMNLAKAGQTIALRWRLLDSNGVPVADLTNVKVTVASLPCSLGTTSDQIEEYASGASGLQNLGDGYYQFNWKSPSAYAGSCKVLKLDLGEGAGYERIALFQFRK